MNNKYLGEFEQLILLAVLALKENAYGMTVRWEIHERTGRDVAIGAVYTTLDRLEAKGLVISWIADATQERGGRAKRFFKLEAAGQRALRDALTATTQMVKGLEPKLGLPRFQPSRG
jgi:PadR family transcriptional regulator, regulatory protein PadR